jgi:hypothetical protein
MSIHIAISGDRNMIKTKTDNTSIYKDLTLETAHVERKNGSDASRNRGNWNHLRIIQKVPEKYRENTTPRKRRKHSHLGTAGILEKVQIVCHEKQRHMYHKL